MARLAAAAGPPLLQSSRPQIPHCKFVLCGRCSSSEADRAALRIIFTNDLADGLQIMPRAVRDELFGCFSKVCGPTGLSCAGGAWAVAVAAAAGKLLKVAES